MKAKILGLLLLMAASLFFLQCTKSSKNNSSVGESAPGELAQQLAERAAESAEKMPAEQMKIAMDAIKDLKEKNVAGKALKEGGILPNFNLPDISKGNINSRKLNEKGPLIITFYRGSWCPYCNLQLRDLQKNLPAIKATGAELVAISPEMPDRTAEMVKKEGLGFYVLSDVKGVVSKKFGLSYEFGEDLKKLYLEYGLDLAAFNGSDKWELPLAATYVVDRNGKIVYSFIDNDYKKRAETAELIAVLKKLTAAAPAPEPAAEEAPAAEEEG